jgi:hypothetical protein
MNFGPALIAAALCFPLMCCAQEASIPPLKSEPHHHLVLNNPYVNVYSVEVQPHDSVRLHRHEADGIGIMLNDSEITVRAPGKPDSHQNVTKGQLRLQTAGFVHSTYIEGVSPYRNVTVELLKTQTTPQNLCATIIAAQPTHCPPPSDKASLPGLTNEPQFQTDQTKIALIRISPGQNATLEVPALPQLLVFLDEQNGVTENNSGKFLRAGDCLWREANSAAQVFKNASPTEMRVVLFTFKDERSAK